MINVLVADNNVDLCRVIERYLSEQEDMDVVGVAYDGEQAIDLIKKTSPDIVILDITMPKLDGIGVLEVLNKEALDPRPRVIVLTAFARDAMVQRMTELGADYFIVKPFDLQVLVSRIRQFVNPVSSSQSEQMTVNDVPRSPTEDPSRRLTELLKKMGVPAHFKGYTYLREAVLLTLENDSVHYGLTKELYPQLAERYDSSPTGVEAAIRNAIMAAWRRGNRRYIASLMGTDATDEDRFPTNSMLIARLADRLRLEQSTS